VEDHLDNASLGEEKKENNVRQRVSYALTSAPSALDIEEAFRWLSVSRNLLLVERKSKEYVWSVIAEKSDNGTTGTTNKIKVHRQWSVL
jgi:hypothetical protein